MRCLAGVASRILLRELVPGYAQSRLPPCPPDHSTVWTNCFGKYTYSDSDPPGAKYVGEFRNDKRNGKGTYIHPDGWKYVGEFRNNLRNGQGTYFYPDGSKYVGEFRNDKSNGQGTYYLPDGSIGASGTWSDDELVQS